MRTVKVTIGICVCARTAHGVAPCYHEIGGSSPTADLMNIFGISRLSYDIILWLLPDLTCRVLAEDENLLQDAKQQWMQLKLSRVDSKPTSLLPDPPRKNHAAAAAVFTFSSVVT